MKGMCQSASLIKSVFDKNYGLEHSFVSHLTCFQLPDKDNFGILTDSAVNIAPDEETIIKEIDNANILFQKLNKRVPLVALLAANEKVSDKMPSTKLAESVTKRLIDRTDLIVEGPVAFDLAVSQKSVQIKKYKGKLNGNADIFVAPRIETANALYKSLQHYIKADMGGILFGACCPIIHPSRADNAITKYYSLLLGLSTL
jgi:phosphate butyryltransferase